MAVVQCGHSLAWSSSRRERRSALEPAGAARTDSTSTTDEVDAGSIVVGFVRGAGGPPGVGPESVVADVRADGIGAFASCPGPPPDSRVEAAECVGWVRESARGFAADGADANRSALNRESGLAPPTDPPPDPVPAPRRDSPPSADSRCVPRTGTDCPSPLALAAAESLRARRAPKPVGSRTSSAPSRRSVSTSSLPGRRRFVISCVPSKSCSALPLDVATKRPSARIGLGTLGRLWGDDLDHRLRPKDEPAV